MTKIELLIATKGEWEEKQKPIREAEKAEQERKEAIKQMSWEQLQMNLQGLGYNTPPYRELMDEMHRRGDYSE